MGDIAQRGNRLTKGKGQAALGGTRDRPGRHPPVKQRARRAHLFGGGRTNLLEELGRVEGERSNPNRRAEISRVHGELNRGYAKGGVVRRAKKFKTHGKDVPTMAAEGGRAGHAFGHIAKAAKLIARKLRKPKPHRDKPPSKTHGKDVPTMAAEGGRAGHFAGSLVKNIPKLLKKLGTEIKDAPLPPQLQKTLDEVKKLQQLQKPRVKKAAGGRIGKKHGFQVLGGGVEGKPHSTREGRDAAGRRRFKRWTGEDWSKGPGSRRKGRRMGRPGRGKDFKTHGRDVTTMAAEGGRIGFKKGGSDKNWIQKAVNPKHKGYCTPMTKKTCTPARKALARTFKKKAKTGW